MSTRRKKIVFPKKNQGIRPESLCMLVHCALAEDLQLCGDITSDSLFRDGGPTVTARLVAKEDGIVCGLQMAEAVYRAVDTGLKVTCLKKDGDPVKKGDVLFRVKGCTASILKGERTALNFVGLLSGVATKAHRLSSSIRKYKTKLLDTRKTLPGLRELQKYAVATGGASNHRMGLFDMILIKENHIHAAGGIVPAVKLARERHPDVPVEIEVESLEQVRTALETDADVLMLDNMDNGMVKKSLELIAGRKYVEVSGNVDEDRLVSLAKLGVDFVSMGELTHTVKNLDISLRID